MRRWWTVLGVPLLIVCCTSAKQRAEQRLFHERAVDLVKTVMDSLSIIPASGSPGDSFRVAALRSLNDLELVNPQASRAAMLAAIEPHVHTLVREYEGTRFFCTNIVRADTLPLTDREKERLRFDLEATPLDTDPDWFRISAIMTQHGIPYPATPGSSTLYPGEYWRLFTGGLMVGDSTHRADECRAAAKEHIMTWGPFPRRHSRD